MKFGQLMEYNMTNIFFLNHTQNVEEKLFPDPFPKKARLGISLDQQSKALWSLFLLYAKFKSIEIQWNQAADHLLLPYITLF